MTITRFSLSQSLIAASALLGLVVACDADDVTQSSATSSGAGADVPLFVVLSTVETPDDRLGYFVTTSSLEGGAKIDIGRGIEEPGGGRLYVEPGIGTFMVGGGSTPTITRYEVTADGSLERGAVLSFANQGVSDLADDAVVFVDATKAYLRDPSQLQLISFDPTAMLLLDVLPVEGVGRSGLYAGFGQAVRRADGIYFPMTYSDEEEAWTRVPDEAVLVHVDPSNDRITVSTDSRCTSMDVGFSSESGDAYWFSDRANTFGWRADPPSPGARRDCALRLRAGESSFDQSWSLDLTTRTRGWPVVASVPAGGSRLWLRVLEEDAFPVTAGATPLDVEALQGWQWYLLDVESDEPAQRNEQRPAGSYYSNSFRVDDRTYTTESNADYTATTLLEIDAAEFRVGATLEGTVRGLARLR